MGVGADVHVVTQLMLSLLGLVVFPWEKQSFDKLLTWPLDSALYGAKSYHWNIIKDTYPNKCASIGSLLRHLRNAVSHRHVLFSSDSRDAREVDLSFSDIHPKHLEWEWCANITAVDLREFCVGLLNTIWVD